MQSSDPNPAPSIRCLNEYIILLVAISIEDMHSLANRNDNTWGIKGYEPLKVYHDPDAAIKARDLAKIPKGTP